MPVPAGFLPGGGAWAIVNRGHCVRDMTLVEDRPQVTSSGAAQTVAALRNLTINRPGLAGEPNIAAVLRRHVDRAFTTHGHGRGSP